MYVHTAMPSQTYYVKSEHVTLLDELADREGLDNPSQALQHVLDEYREEYNA